MNLFPSLDNLGNNIFLKKCMCMGVYMHGHLCEYSCGVGACVLWYACGGERSVSGVGPYFPVCLRQSLVHCQVHQAR